MQCKMIKYDLLKFKWCSNYKHEHLRTFRNIHVSFCKQFESCWLNLWKLVSFSDCLIVLAMKILSPANNWIHEARSELIPPVGNGGFDFANLININAWLFVFKFEFAIDININVNHIFLNYDYDYDTEHFGDNRCCSKLNAKHAC